MKYFFTFIITLTMCFPVGLAAQETAQESLDETVQITPEKPRKSQRNAWRKTDDHWTRKNSISVTGYAMSFSTYGTVGFGHTKIEYDRALPYNLSVSAVGIVYAPLQESMIADTYRAYENFWFTGVKLNYNLPVVRNWLYLRMGVGIGVGFHNVTKINLSGWFDEGPPPPPRNWTKVNAIVDVQWVLRVNRWLELRFAPGLVSPSQFIVGPSFNDPYFEGAYFYFDMMGMLGATVRF